MAEQDSASGGLAPTGPGHRPPPAGGVSRRGQGGRRARHLLSLHEMPALLQHVASRGVQRTSNGSAIGASRCPAGALSTCSAGWRKTYISQIVELVEMGAGQAGQDGTAFYFDEFPSSPTGDWSRDCRSEFAKRFGHPMPDNATREVLAFNQAMTEEYFQELVHAIGNATSRAAALVSITFAPSLDNHDWKNYTQTIEASYSPQSVAKVEFSKGLVARPILSKPALGNSSDASCAHGWSPAIGGRSPGSVLGQANASCYGDCQAACCKEEGCLAIIFAPQNQNHQPPNNCHLLDRVYNTELQCLPGEHTVVANRFGGGVPPTVCPAAGPQLVPGAPIDHDVLLSWAWGLGRGASEWRPPHTWIPFLQTAEQALCATSALRAYGHIANPDHVEGKIPDTNLFGEVYKIAAMLDKAIAGALPPRALRYAAVVHSERARNTLFASADGGLAEAWRRLLYPAAGMWTALVRSGTPGAVIPEWLLEKVADEQDEEGGESCGGFSVLLAPAEGFLDIATEAVIAQCEQRGVAVIRAEAGDDWEDANSRERLGQEMLSKANTKAGAPPLSFATRQSAANPRHVTAFELNANPGEPEDQKALLIHVLNDFAWCAPGRPNSPLPPSAPPVTGLKLLVRAPVGSTATARDILTGKTIPLTKVPGARASQLELALPSFKQFMVLRVEFTSRTAAGVSKPTDLSLKADDSGAAATRIPCFAPPIISAVSPTTFAVEGGDSVLVTGEALIRAGSTGAVCRINSPLSGGTTFRHGGYACGKAVEQNVNCVGDRIDFPATVLNATHLRCTPPAVVVGGAGALSVSLNNGSIYTFSKPLHIRYEELVDVAVGRRPYITESEGALLLALSPRLVGSVITVRKT